MSRLISCHVLSSQVEGASLTVWPNQMERQSCSCLRLLPCYCSTHLLDLATVRAARDRVIARRRREGEEDKWQMKMKEVMSGTDRKMEEMLKEVRMLRAELTRQDKTHSEML